MKKPILHSIQEEKKTSQLIQLFIYQKQTKISQEKKIKTIIPHELEAKILNKILIK